MSLTTFNSRSEAATSSIPPETGFIRLAGYWQAGDGGEASYRRLPAAPTAAMAWHFQSADGGWWELAEQLPNVRQFGARGDGVALDAAAINAALLRGGEVLFPAGTYVMDAPMTPDSRSVLRGIGRAVVKAANGSAAGTLLFSASSKTDITVHDLEFDGNMPNMASFAAMVVNYKGLRVVFERCRFVNSKGIAFYNGDSRESGIRFCSFENCGTYNRISGSSSDRKQAFASSFGKRSLPYGGGNFTIGCSFTDIGLDCISFASGDDDGQILGNRIRNNDAGSIYVSASSRVVVADNNVSNGDGGNGIDVHSARDVVIKGNVCNGNGAAGILVAGASSDISVTGNICKNNWQGGTSTHRGGITLSAPSGSTVFNVVLSGNVCDDDQGAATTQTHAVGVVPNGTFRNVRIADDNILIGRTSTGEASKRLVFQNPGLGAQPYPLEATLANLQEVALCPDTMRGKLSIHQINNNYYAEFYLRGVTNPNPSELLDSGAHYELSDTGTGGALFRDAASGLIKFRNRFGTDKIFVFVLNGSTA
jgi:parallel beta-helix repeat protein